MLVRFTDTKDKPVWVNPVHVKSLTPKKPEVTSINMSVPTAAPINVRMPIDEVAARLNAAMPLDPYAMTAEDDAASGYSTDGGSSAAIAAAIM
jgi:hypothetical protein